MPTNHTENYALSQWERSDRILMEDFNADNAKIDAALKAGADARTTLAGQVAKKAEKSALDAEVSARKSAVTSLTDQNKLHTIVSHTQSGSTTQIKLDPSGISWSSWRRVYLFITPKGSGTSRAGFNDMVNVFDLTNNGGGLCLVLMPMYTSSLKVTGLLTGADIRLVKSSNTYSSLNNLEITCSSGGTIASGFKVVLKGEK